MSAAEPDVSVVVIAFNDAARLPRALRSVQRQTLRNMEIIVVDDASTDDTAAIVRALAEADPRIRYECLPANSGGCSAPRNRGVELARAPWVMFCDSDDEYERHACKNLLRAAERWDADVVCGTAERVDVSTGRTKRWRPDVHDSVRVADGLEDFGDLIFDTISVNKIYRRSMLDENGIRFPEGLLFEDQLFTIEAFAAAGRIAAIPEVVYRWYVDRLSDEPSITQRRHEASNVESRIEVNRRIDSFLAERGLHGVQLIKDLKFLKHDLYLYLSSMLDVDDATAQTLIDRLVPYVSSVNLEPAWQVRPALRVAIYHLLIDDLAGIRAAMRFVKWASVVAVPIVEADGREGWGCEHWGAGPDAVGVSAREWLDVTPLHLLSLPFSQRRYLHELEALSLADGVVTATGSTIDYDGSLSVDDRVELRFLIGGARTAASIPAAWTGRSGERLTWRAEGAVRSALGRPLEDRDRGTLGLAVASAGHVNVTAARCPAEYVPSLTLRLDGPTSRTRPDRLAILPRENGAIGWQAVPATAARDRAEARRRRWSRIPGARWLLETSAAAREAFLPRAASRLGALLPARRLALFETNAGRTANGNARAVSEALFAERPEIAQAWVWRDDTDRVPDYADGVERLSLRHVWLAARARYWIDDGSAALSVRPRRGATVVFAGNGVPVHRIGLDDPSVLVSRSQVREVRRRGRRWTLLLSASSFDSAVTPRALGYSGPVAEVGLARTDSALSPAATEQAKARLDLPTDRPIVLYAPTLREPSRIAVSPLLDLDEWAQRLGDRCYLLVRPHPRERFAVSTRLRHAVRDVGDVDEIGLLLAAADLMVSDFSSLLADAALVGTPIIAFQPDRETYVNRTHGVYSDASALGPVTLTTQALLDEVEAWLADPARWDLAHASSRAAFAEDFCGPADGRSTRRAVQAILGRADDQGVSS